MGGLKYLLFFSERTAVEMLTAEFVLSRINPIICSLFVG
jgi:hypothetical protein